MGEVREKEEEGEKGRGRMSAEEALRVLCGRRVDSGLPIYRHRKDYGEVRHFSISFSSVSLGLSLLSNDTLISFSSLLLVLDNFWTFSNSNLRNLRSESRNALPHFPFFNSLPSSFLIPCADSCE